jgi:membrane-associated phospholipid phosphatase
MERLIANLVGKLRRVFREKLHYQTEDLPYYLTIIVAFIVFVIGLNGFVDLTEELAENQLGGFDNTVTQWILSFRSEKLTTFLTFITHIGGNGYVVVITLLVLYFLFIHRSWKFILQTVTVLLLATLSNIALKQVINRARPSLEHLVEVYTLSYPSGHAMSAMGFYGFLIFLVARFQVAVAWKVVLISLLVFLILAIGVSRIYLGVHYPSDVLAGYIGGLIWVTFCAIVFDVIDLWRRRKQRISQLKALEDKNDQNIG